VQHIQALRSLHGLENAKIVFVPESNLAFEGVWTSFVLQRAMVRNICIMREDKGMTGVRVNREFKKLMAMGLKEKLLSGKVYMHRRFVCTGEDYSPKAMKNEMIDQLLNYSRKVKFANDEDNESTVIYGGKMGYGFDDHVIALQLNLVMKERFFIRRDVYAEYY
jgi:hypothetical protein